ncbi:MAG: DNA (cytosine-5-)-methyltransferase [Natrinema limicola]
MSLKVLDLFCGAGGFSLGFSRAGFYTVAAIDNDEDALATYRYNLQDLAYCLDLGAYPANEILELIDIGPDDVDVIIGGPPCTRFSPLAPEDDPDALRSLLQTYLDYVEAIEPRAFVMENVKGLPSRYREYLDAVLDRADSLDYDVDYRVLTASDYGVPQGRERIFIVGIYGSEGVEFKWPTPTTEDNPPTARSVLWGGALPRDGWPNSKESSHQPHIVENWREGGYKNDPYTDSQHQIRLHPDEPSWTITAGNQHFHPAKPRALTPREEASLQSFPRWYHFAGGMGSASKQVGNAVPPKLAEHIGRALLQSLGEPDTLPTDSVGMTMKQIAGLSGHLTEREVEAILLRSAGLTWEQVGDEMDISLKTASNLYYRAEKKVEEAEEKIKRARETIDSFERLTRGDI